MFFSWYFKNRHFKQGGNLRGQIAPFMLVVLAVLLVAAIAAINIGRVGIDKTYSNNGADAGSLAAASAWAGAFNALCEWNKSIREYYDVNYYTYGQLSDTAKDHLDEAINYSIAASAELAVLTGYTAIAGVGSPVGTSKDTKMNDTQCGGVYVDGIIYGIADMVGAVLLFEAYQATTAARATLEFMKSLTETFHEQQLKNYSDARDYMNDSYINAQKTGLSYAFANSGISAKLSDSQGTAFSAWLKGNPSGAYSWTDSVPQTHTVSAGLDLPNIDHYKLEHTVGSYSKIIEELDGLIEDAGLSATLQYSTATTLAASGGIFFIAVALSIIYIILIAIPFCQAAAEVVCEVLKFMAKAMIALNKALAIIIAALVSISSITSVFLLSQINDETLDDWGEDGTQLSSRPADARDLMIVQISEVILPRWTAICTISQLHPGTTGVGIVDTVYPTVSSFSESTFGGGDVGEFSATYNSSIVSAS